MTSQRLLKTFLYTLCVFLLCLALLPLVYSQHSIEVRNFTLVDIGFASDVVLAGHKPYQAFFFPIPRGEIVKERSSVEFHLRFSTALDSASIVSISVNDLPARSYTLQQIGSTEVVFKIPLAGLDFVPIPGLPEVTKKRFLKVTISGLLLITGDLCRDIESGGLYVVAKRESSVSLAVEPDIRGMSIASFFADTEGDFHVVLPQKPTGGTFQMGLWISGDLKKRLLYTPRKVSRKSVV